MRETLKNKLFTSVKKTKLELKEVLDRDIDDKCNYSCEDSNDPY